MRRDGWELIKGGKADIAHEFSRKAVLREDVKNETGSGGLAFGTRDTDDRSRAKGKEKFGGGAERNLESGDFFLEKGLIGRNTGGFEDKIWLMRVKEVLGESLRAKMSD